MSSPEILSEGVQTIVLASGQCLTLHLKAGAVVHVQQGRVVVAGAPRWLAEQMCQVPRNMCAGGVRVMDTAGWHQLVARGPVQLRIMTPAARPGLWSLLKSRLGRSGLLLGNARPPDIQAAEESVPHATSQ
ncbi:hypothetical protein [Cupriavidus pauculus]|uniref:DUF2917 domain-containing protein n=1 Tax=Cupriavidus pauculus TaxID=82633 RepID=A0A2N5C927_9BURK|nr:hypothetical protein [Cupriavidus pauculus]PLP98716.1 hypothetical protein CYJ10_20680 [Cupriavidus pauculus]